MIEMVKKHYTTGEAATLCGVYATTVLKWVNAGKLKAIATTGGHKRIQEGDLRRFMQKYEMPLPPIMIEAEQAQARRGA